MKAPHLPGLPVISALMLAGVISAAITINGGPAHISYDILKDFQPTIAALVAVIAASLAYKGAMAKVGLDREMIDREHVKERLGLYIRLISQLRRLQQEAVFTKDFLNDRMQEAIDSRIKWDEQVLALTGEFDEIENAWKKIELLPPEAFSEVDKLRDVLSRAKSDSEPKIDAGEVGFFSARTYRRGLERIYERTSALLEIMEAALERLKRLDRN